MMCWRHATGPIRLLLLGVALDCSGIGSAGGGDGSDSLLGLEGQNPDATDAEEPDGGSPLDGLDTDGWLPPEHCGNGSVDPGEECDDGNRLNGDDCDWACRVGPGSPDPLPVGPADTLEVDRAPGPVEESTRGAAVFPVTCDAPLPFLWIGDSYATVWIDDSDSSRPIGRFLRIDRAGSRVGPEWQFVYESRWFSQLALAWSGREFALVWCPALAAGPVSGILLDHEGKPTGPPVTLAEDGADCRPSVEFDGDAFVVAWGRGSSSQLNLLRWDPDDELPGAAQVRPLLGEGRYIALTRLAVHNGSTMVAVLDDAVDSGGGEWLAWVRWVPLDPVSLRLIGESRSLGQAHVPYFDLAAGDTFAVLATIVPDGGFHYTCEAGTLYHVALDHEGQLSDAPTPIRCPRSCEECWNEDPYAMAMAWGLGGWVVAFRSMSDGAVLVRCDARGTAIQAQSIPAWSGFASTIEVAFDGEGFGVLGLDDTGPVFARYVVVP